MESSFKNNTLALWVLDQHPESKLSGVKSGQITHASFFDKIYLSGVNSGFIKKILPDKIIKMPNIEEGVLGKYIGRNIAIIDADYIFFLLAGDELLINQNVIDRIKKIIFDSHNKAAIWGAFEFLDESGSLGTATELHCYQDGADREIFITRGLDKRFDGSISGAVIPVSAILQNRHLLEIYDSSTMLPELLLSLQEIDKIYQLEPPTVKAYLDTANKRGFQGNAGISFYLYQWITCKQSFLKKRLLRLIIENIFCTLNIRQIFKTIKICFRICWFYGKKNVLLFPLATIVSTVNFVIRRINPGWLQ